MEWILVVYIFGGTIAFDSMPNFKTEKACLEAGVKVETLSKNSGKTLRFTCVKN